MTGMTKPPARRPGRSALARAALLLYPPAWRARYGAEVTSLIEESGGGIAAAASLAWRALPAWIWPPRHLHDRDSRMRASLGTVLVAGALLGGVGLVFAQLTQFQGLRAQGSPVVSGSYALFDVAMAVAGLTAAAGGFPLWLLMLRRARREHRTRDTGYLLLPIAVPAAFAGVLAAVARIFGGPEGVSPRVFLAVTLLGFCAAVVSCAGPILAMQRLRPRGPAVRLAVRAAAVATAAIVAAGVASVTAVAGLCLRAPGFAGYHNGLVVGGYLAVVAVLAAAATVGARRAPRARQWPAHGSGPRPVKPARAAGRPCPICASCLASGYAVRFLMTPSACLGTIE
jgi:hypothetical protein